MTKYIKTFMRYRYLLMNFIERDIKVKYRRSVLGLLWSVLNPLLMMAVISTVFSTVMRISVANFHLYYLTAAVVYNFISEATNGAMTSVFTSGAIMKKVYIPKYIFPLEKVLFSFVNMLFSLIAVLIVIIITMVVNPGSVSFSWTMLLFPIPLIMALIFSFGLGLLLAAATVFFRDIMHLYGVFLTAWMYATPIIWDMASMQNPLILTIMKFNPMYYYVTFFRDVMIYNRVPSIPFMLAGLACAVVMLLIGLAVFKKKQDMFVLYM